MRRRLILTTAFGVVALALAWGWSERDRFLNPVDRSLTADQVDIDFWYGPVQRFGHLGRAQRWINVLGNVQPARQVASLSYALDQGPERALSIGGDLHRLALAGDFNAEVDFAEVDAGDHILRVTATLRNGVLAHDEVVLRVEKGQAWPLPYTVDFSAVDDLQDVVQVVDGDWRLEPDGVRTVQRYYDRVLTLGDTTWTDYEATVRLTIHDFTPPEYSAPTYNVTHFGVAMRWRGHHDDGLQPRRKWYPLGAQGEFLVRTQPDSSRWRILRDQSDDKPQLYQPGYNPTEIGTPMTMRTQVVTMPDGRTRYRFKQWSDGRPEPEGWDVEGYETGDYPSGALCLVPHNTDVTIHEVTVEPVTAADLAVSDSAPAGVIWRPEGA